MAVVGVEQLSIDVENWEDVAMKEARKKLSSIGCHLGEERFPVAVQLREGVSKERRGFLSDWHWPKNVECYVKSFGGT